MNTLNNNIGAAKIQARVLPLVSIVIPVYNGKRTIRLCLDAIQQLDYPKERYEVLVVDNNSTDGTPEIVAEYPARLLYERELQGPHAATNTGVRQARGEIIAFTDSDCVPAPGWLRALVAPFADEEIVAAGGKIEAYQPSSRVERFIQVMKPLKNCLQMSDTFPVSLITANAAYRADALHAVGLFNANMYTGSEVDLAWRVQRLTKKKVAYAPDAVIYHKFSPSLRQLFRHQRIYGISEIMLGTLYKDSGYSRPPGAQMRLMFSQVRSLFIYMFSLVYRALTASVRKRDLDYVLFPALWLIAETGSLCGKVEGLWLTRFYRKQFWAKGPRVI
jgi:cellulose synthase/poly-beta-1,6-N-acetylglucosamine synthase-like glycosyltransferase